MELADSCPAHIKEISISPAEICGVWLCDGMWPKKGYKTNQNYCSTSTVLLKTMKVSYLATNNIPCADLDNQTFNKNAHICGFGLSDDLFSEPRGLTSAFLRLKPAISASDDGISRWATAGECADLQHFQWCSDMELKSQLQVTSSG